jgi:hypothetical protein
MENLEKRVNEAAICCAVHIKGEAITLVPVDTPPVAPDLSLEGSEFVGIVSFIHGKLVADLDGTFDGRVDMQAVGAAFGTYLLERLSLGAVAAS